MQSFFMRTRKTSFGAFVRRYVFSRCGSRSQAVAHVKAQFDSIPIYVVKIRHRVSMLPLNTVSKLLLTSSFVGHRSHKLKNSIKSSFFNVLSTASFLNAVSYPCKKK